jgi:hypothetical protein
MIRIFTADEPEAITLTVDGRLVDECVDAVEMNAGCAMELGRPVHLFLRDVSHIGERGRAMLSRLASRGVHLSARGIYSSFIVAEISRVRTEPSDGRRRVAARNEGLLN